MMSSNAAQDGSHGHVHSHNGSHAHSHSHGERSAPSKPGDVPEPSAATLLATRIGILGIVGFVLFVTISFCTGVYFDRESAFHNALRCCEEVLNGATVPHWLQNGTLLGATRLGRLVLWDADLDYGLLDGDGADLAAVSAELDARCFGYRTSERGGTVNTEFAVWRKCTHRLCADFHVARRETRSQPPGGGEPEEVVVTGDGASPAGEVFPLQPCRVADVNSTCPHNAAFFLAQAYGSEWLTKPLTKLF